MKIEQFKIEDWCNKYEHLAKYNLADACIASLSIEELLKLSNENLDKILYLKLNYNNVHGSERLRHAISNLYLNKKIENISVTHGTIGANQLVYQTLLEKDDEVIVFLPIYQQHYSVPKSLGVSVKYLYLSDKNNWLPDTDELKRIVTQKTKMIVLNNPNNPTGSIISDDLMQEIIAIANGAYILSDEVYKELELNNSFTSISDLYERGISSSSVSKAFSLAGLRVGWISTDKNLIKKINTMREYNIISMSLIDDYFASIAIENKDKILDKNKLILNQGYNILSEWINNKPMLKCIMPQGATTAFVKYNKKISSYELCKNLFKDTGVLLMPGSCFEYESYVRIGYCVDSKMLKKALSIFSDWINNLL